MAVPYSHMYPGPGQYDPDDGIRGPAVTIPHEIKQNFIEKTNDPGPTTYSQYDTVGVLAGYAKSETHPRMTTIQPKRAEF